MKYLILIFSIFLFSSFAYAQESRFQQAHFFDSLYDVPVMTGLVEIQEDSLSYDKIQGRLASVRAIGHDITAQQVRSFYRATLPQMGWREVAPLNFVRERENLIISFEKSMASSLFQTVVVFDISPVQ